MRIVQLTAENLLRLVAVDITPDPESGTVVISGPNAAGKTSILNSIWLALGGGQASKEFARPVRDGEDHAEVRLDLGDLIVTRRWNADGKSTLHVENHDGARYTSPQAMLDSLVGRLSFDPLSFASAPPRTQLATLLELVDLPFVPAELDNRRRGIFDRRTEVNRDLKALRARLDGMPKPAADVPAEEVSAADLLAEARAAQDQARAIDDAVRAVDDVRAAADAADREVIDLTERLEQAKVRAAAHRARLTEAAAAVEAMPAPADLGEIEARLAQLEETNAVVRAVHARQALADELAGIEERSKDLTAQLEAIDAEKEVALAAAEMPIDGLGFDDDGVTYQGVPFAQCSAAEKLRVSLAMAMAMNPQLRVVRITDGSLLDDDGMRLVTEMAEANDFQCWIEVVARGEPVGVVIEEGAVTSTPDDREVVQ